MEQLNNIVPEQKRGELYRVLRVNPTDDIEVIDQVGSLLLLNSKNVTHIRGIVVDIFESPKIIADSFPTTSDIEQTSEVCRDMVSDIVNGDGIVRITDAREGTILRLFKTPNHDGIPEEYRSKWQISTMKTLIAWNSKWDGPTFGSMFNEIWKEDNYTKLNSEICYIFLLRHPSARLVCKRASMAHLVHLGSFIPEDGGMRMSFDAIEGIDVVSPKLFESREVDELLHISSEMDGLDTTGMLYTLYSKTYQPIRAVKVLAKNYTSLLGLRGGESNMRIVYLNALIKNDDVLIRDVYSESAELFNNTDSKLLELNTRLENIYRDRYITKLKFTDEPKVWHLILIKALNLSGGVKERINRVLSQQTSVQLNKAINMLDDKKRSREMLKNLK